MKLRDCCTVSFHSIRAGVSRSRNACAEDGTAGHERWHDVPGHRAHRVGAASIQRKEDLHRCDPPTANPPSPPQDGLTDPAVSRAHTSSLSAASPKISALLQSFISAIRSGRAGDVEAMLSSGTVDSTSGAHAAPQAQSGSTDAACRGLHFLPAYLVDSMLDSHSGGTVTHPLRLTCAFGVPLVAELEANASQRPISFSSAAIRRVLQRP